MSNAKFVKEIMVTDPDTQGEVHLAVYKHENGGIFAIDSSFVEQIADGILEDDRAIIVDPFYDVFELKDGEPLYLILKD
jgi:hypothetical protein